MNADDGQNPTDLTDLRSPTPFVYVETYSVSSCANNPTSFWVGVAAYVSTTLFTPPDDMDLTFSDQSTVLVSWTFPQLIVTILTPGEEIEMVVPRNALLPSSTGISDDRNGTHTLGPLRQPSTRRILRSKSSRFHQ
jgi:hypothetical protein